MKLVYCIMGFIPLISCDIVIIDKMLAFISTHAIHPNIGSGLFMLAMFSLNAEIVGITTKGIRQKLNKKEKKC